MVPFRPYGKYAEFSPDYYHAIRCQVAQGTSPDNRPCDGFAGTRRARPAVGQTLSLGFGKIAIERQNLDGEDDEYGACRRQERGARPRHAEAC